MKRLRAFCLVICVLAGYCSPSQADQYSAHCYVHRYGRYVQNYGNFAKYASLPARPAIQSISTENRHSSVRFQLPPQNKPRSFRQYGWFEDDILFLSANKSTDEDTIESALEKVHGTVLGAYQIGNNNILKVQTEKGKLLETERQLKTDTTFKAMQRNWRWFWSAIPLPPTRKQSTDGEDGDFGSASQNDPMFPQQWYLRVCRTSEAASMAGRRMKPVPVALLDSGCNQIADLKGRLDESDQQLVQSGCLIDDAPGGGHGTKLASVCVASGDNGIGTAGLNPSGNLLSVKLSKWDTPTDEDMLLAFYKLISTHPEIKIVVIGCTPAGGENIANHPMLHDILTTFAGAGSRLIFLPAGNRSKQVAGAIEPYIVTVASSDETGDLCSFSNFGPIVSFMAPGTNILCTDKNGVVCNAAGTSVSAAMVATIASMVWGLDTSMSSQELLKVLNGSATFHRKSKMLGYGVIDAEQAFRYVLRQSEE